MSTKYFAAARLLAAVVAIVAAGSALTAQNRAVPRTPWGAPDLQGVWSFATVTPLERPEGVAGEFLTAAEIAAIERRAVIAATDEARGADAARDVAGAYNDFWWDRGTRVAGRRSSLIVEPKNGRMPALTPAARTWADSDQARIRQETRGGDLPASSYEDTDLWDRCLTRSLPIVPGPYNNNIEIIQTPTHVAINHEMIHDVRIVPLGKTPHLPAGVDSWFGSIRGRWEGETLVVESRNFRDLQELPFAPRMTAAGMTLVERFTRLPNGNLNYQFTVDHPRVYTQPWTAVMEMAPGEAVFEYACHEGNHAMEGILKGSRLIESTAKPTTASR
jgi:hypothetical protein